MKNSSGKKKKQKNITTVGELIMEECASVTDVYISFTQRSGRLECHSRFVGPGGWDGFRV